MKRLALLLGVLLVAAPALVSFQDCFVGSNTSFQCQNNRTSCGSLSTSGTGGTYTSFSTTLKGVIKNGSNAGNINVIWAQGASDAGTTYLRAGSFMRYRQVD